MKNSNNGVNIYDKVYALLLDKGEDKIRPYEFYYLVENLKINNNEILDMIRGVLSDAGFNEGNIERISNNLSWKLRFTRADAREIEKEMCKKGWICRKKNYIIINGGL